MADNDELSRLKMGAPALAFSGKATILATISQRFGLLMAPNIISISVEKVKSPARLSKYLFDLEVFESFQAEEPRHSGTSRSQPFTVF